MAEAIIIQEEMDLVEQSLNLLTAWLKENPESPIAWAVTSYLTHMVLTDNIEGDFQRGFTLVPKERVRHQVAWATIVNGMLVIQFEEESRPQIYYAM